MILKLGTAEHTFKPSTQEAEEGGSPLVQGQPSLPCDFLDSQGYRDPISRKKQKILRKKAKLTLVYI